MPAGLLRRRAVFLVPARLQRDLRFRCWEVPAAVPWKERGACVFCPAWSRWLLPGVLLPVGQWPCRRGHRFRRGLSSGDCSHCRQSQSSRVATSVTNNRASRGRALPVRQQMFSVVHTPCPLLRESYFLLGYQPIHLC